MPVEFDNFPRLNGKFKLCSQPLVIYVFTPQCLWCSKTIVVSPDGKVLQNWVGAYTEVRQSEVEKFFEVSLPGLTPEN